MRQSLYRSHVSIRIMFLTLGAASSFGAVVALGQPSAPWLSVQDGERLGSSAPRGGASATAFIENLGQVSGPARYYAISGDSRVYFEPDAVVLQHLLGEAGKPGITVRIDFPQAKDGLLLSANRREPGVVNVYRSANPAEWKIGIPIYADVRYDGIAPGVGMVYRGDRGHLKYDVVVRPGADLSAVQLRYEGVNRLEINATGGLKLLTDLGTLMEESPIIYRQRRGERVRVRGGYRLLQGNRLGFWAMGYGVEDSLIIDPGILWSTFLGGSGADQIFGATTDAMGNVYVTGTTQSADYPVNPGAYRSQSGGNGDVIVTKLRSDGATLEWSAILGGIYLDEGRGIMVGAGGDVYVTGDTSSPGFPVTFGAYSTSYAGGLSDCFVARLSPAGVLVYSTFFGGLGSDVPRGVRVDGTGNVVVAGSTSSSNFPVTTGVVRTRRYPSVFDAGDGFVTKVNGSGSALLFSTYLGTDYGTDVILGIALDVTGQPTVTGFTTSPGFPTTPGALRRTMYWTRDGFVTRLSALANAYVYSTFVGGSDRNEPTAIAVDAAANAFVTGTTLSADFPVTANAGQRSWGGGYDGFALELNPTGAGLVYSTYIGGGGTDVGYGVVVSAYGDACVAGETESVNLPVTANAFDRSANGNADGFLARVTALGGFSTASYLGSAGTDAATSVAIKQSSGHLVVAGHTDGSGFPSTVGAYDPSQNGAGTLDGFVAAFDVGIAAVLPAGVGPHAGLIQVSAQPNPFRDHVAIRLSVDRPERVSILVRDVQGRLVRTLMNGTLAAGSSEWWWDGHHDKERAVASGVYFVEIETPDATARRTLVRLR